MYKNVICLNLYLFIFFSLFIQLSKQSVPKSSTDKKKDTVENTPKKECKWHLDKTKPPFQEKKKPYSKVNHFMLYIGTVDDELAKQNDKPFGDSVKKADRNKRMYIHFTHLNGGEVKMHSLLNTKRDSPLRINNLTQWQMPSFPPKDAIKRAIDSLGCRIKFEMVRRNCQHFVFSIKHGVSFIPIGEGYSCFNKDKFRNHSVHNVLPGSAKLKQVYSTKDAPPNSVFVQVHGESWVNVIEDYMPTLIVDTEANTVDFSVVPPDAWELNWALLKFIHEKVKEIWTLKLTKDGQALKEPALRNALNALTVLEWNFLVQQMYTVVEVALELQSTALKPLENTYPQLAFTRSESLFEALKACHKYWDMSGVDKKLKQVLKNLVGESQSNSLKYPLSGLQYIAANQFGVIDESETGRWN